MQINVQNYIGKKNVAGKKYIDKMFIQAKYRIDRKRL